MADRDWRVGASAIRLAVERNYVAFAPELLTTIGSAAAWQLRAYAINALGVWRYEPAVGAIVAAMTDEPADAEVRAQAVDALALIGTDAALDALVTIAHGEEPLGRGASRAALARLPRSPVEAAESRRRLRLDDLAYERVKLLSDAPPDDVVRVVNAYLADHPAGVHAIEAAARRTAAIEALDWAKVSAAEVAARWEDVVSTATAYLSEHPAGAHAERAAELKAAAADRLAETKRYAVERARAELATNIDSLVKEDDPIAALHLYARYRETHGRDPETDAIWPRLSAKVLSKLLERLRAGALGEAKVAWTVARSLGLAAVDEKKIESALRVAGRRAEADAEKAFAKAERLAAAEARAAAAACDKLPPSGTPAWAKMFAGRVGAATARRLAGGLTLDGDKVGYALMVRALGRLSGPVTILAAHGPLTLNPKNPLHFRMILENAIQSPDVLIALADEADDHGGLAVKAFARMASLLITETEASDVLVVIRDFERCYR